MLKSLDISLTAVINVDVADEVLLHRMAGRRVCLNCRHTYHIDYHPPKESGICDHCGHELIQRPDDLEESVKNRLAIYNEKTKPLLDYYDELGLLMLIDGEQSSTKVFHDIIKKLGEK
jgi:adenylate kinase